MYSLDLFLDFLVIINKKNPQWGMFFNCPQQSRESRLAYRNSNSVSINVHYLKKRDSIDIRLSMVDSGVEVEVWVSLSVRGKLVSFSSLGRFQDVNGIKKFVTPRESKYCIVGVGNKTFKFHQLMCTAFHGEKPSEDHEAHHLDHKPENNRPDNLCWLSQERNKQESHHNRTDRTRKPSGPQKSRKILGRKFQFTEEYPSSIWS